MYNQRQMYFKDKSLYDNKNSIKAMTKINQLCYQVSFEESLFFTSYDRSYKLEEFRLIQRSALNNLSTFLIQKWVIDIEEISKDLIENQGKKWDCLKSKEVYDSSKLKSFLIVIKFMMQSSISNICKRSIIEFYKSFEDRTPKSVKIQSSTEVINQ